MRARWTVLVAMFLSVMVPVSPAVAMREQALDCSEYFADLVAGQSFCEDIAWAAAAGLTTGSPQPTGLPLFRPQGAVTRQAMAAFLYRDARPGQEAPACGTARFADVPLDHPFCPEITWLAEQGISRGTAQATGLPLFKPTDPVSRQAMAAFLHRSAEPGSTAPACAEQVFGDVPVTGTFCPEILWLARAAVATGTAVEGSAPLYEPNQPVSRQAMAAFLHRMHPVPSPPGTLWSWGANRSGSLGIGRQFNTNLRTEVSGLRDVVDIASGQTTTLALRSDGTVWSWGSNEFGQLGIGSTQSQTRPVQVVGLVDIVDVEISDRGSSASYALGADGTVWAWGRNNIGQLGDGTKIDRDVPARVTGLSGVKSVEAGQFSAHALLDDGTVWSWGGDAAGVLGNGAAANSSVPVQVIGLTGVAQLVVSEVTAFAVLTDGTVRSWGSNFRAVLGDGSQEGNRDVPVPVVGLTGIVDVRSHEDYAQALDTGGRVWLWGTTGHDHGTRWGPLYWQPRPVPARIERVGPVAAINGTSHVLLKDGTVWSVGTQAGRVPLLEDITEVVSTKWGRYALRADGTVWTLGPTTEVPVPILGLSGITRLEMSDLANTFVW